MFLGYFSFFILIPHFFIQASCSFESPQLPFSLCHFSCSFSVTTISFLSFLSLSMILFLLLEFKFDFLCLLLRKPEKFFSHTGGLGFPPFIGTGEELPEGTFYHFVAKAPQCLFFSIYFINEAKRAAGLGFEPR